MKIIEKIAKNNEDLHNPSATICFFGDSITQGCFYDGADYEAVYHNIIRKKLNILFPRATTTIINAGIGGDNATSSLERIEQDVISKNPDLCVVCFGLNDMNETDEALLKYRDSISEIFKRLKSFGCEIIFMTPNMMATKVTDSIPPKWMHRADDKIKIMTDGIMDKFMDTAKAVAKEFDIVVCDCYKKWKCLEKMGVDTTALLANGLNHPVREMHELFAYSLLETMFGE